MIDRYRGRRCFFYGNVSQSSGDLSQFGFQSLHAGSQGAVQKLCACEDLETSQDGWVSFVGDLELDSGLVLLQTGQDLGLLLLSEVDG